MGGGIPPSLSSLFQTRSPHTTQYTVHSTHYTLVTTHQFGTCAGQGRPARHFIGFLTPNESSSTALKLLKLACGKSYSNGALSPEAHSPVRVYGTIGQTVWAVTGSGHESQQTVPSLKKQLCTRAPTPGECIACTVLASSGRLVKCLVRGVLVQRLNSSRRHIARHSRLCLSAQAHRPLANCLPLPTATGLLAIREEQPLAEETASGSLASLRLLIAVDVLLGRERLSVLLRDLIEALS